MSNRGGCTLRTLLTERSILERVVYFGDKHVFGPDTSNYTCILILNCRGSTDSLTFERAGPLEEWRYGRQGLLTYIKSNELGSGRWLFADEEVRRLFSRIREQFPVTLSKVAEIRVGVQTSADKIYILQESSSSEDFVNCRWNDREWEIERSILRPCLHDVPLPAYARPVPNAWMIFPYEIVGNPRGQTRARLFSAESDAHAIPTMLAVPLRTPTRFGISKYRWWASGETTMVPVWPLPKPNSI